ncbi:MAG TPA: N-alpha-acetyl diaminobutyric acid deacetylase DoeB, partial [Halomonas sp.]|nr:N-alpha-acetyl diaminobutyric acid deacetylase DoeB [Halomonas sp.]
GVRNFLIHYGLVEGSVEMPEGGQMYLDMPDASCYVQSQHSGVLELLVALGD